MIKKIASIIAMLLMLTLAGCSSQQDAPTDKLQVYASIYPMYDFTAKIGGDRIDLIMMVPSGTEPHDWEPSATDIVGLGKADVFIYNGLGMENWAEKVLDSLDQDDLEIVMASEGIETIPVETGEIDPHIWLSVKNAGQQLENIKEGLSKADPANAAYYEENYQKYEEKFAALDERYSTEMQGLSQKAFVVTHPAFGYLSEEYGLEQLSIEGAAGESDPTPVQLAETIQLIQDRGIGTVFYEDLGSPKLAETVAKEAGASVKALNTLEGLTEEQILEGKDYLSVMEDNLSALIEALQ